MECSRPHWIHAALRLIEMELPRVVFFGRTGEETSSFFNLDLAQWRGKRVLDCPGGPGSFTALARHYGVETLAVDPLYALPAHEMERRCRDDVRLTLERLRQSDSQRPDFDLESYCNDKLVALELFLNDHRDHPTSYAAGALPELGLPDKSFDLVLCGHFMFSYSPRADGGLYEPSPFDLRWHRRGLRELLRLCREEVRLYPAHTITRPARVHPYVKPLLADLPACWQASLEETAYNQGYEGETPMLRIRRI